MTATPSEVLRRMATTLREQIGPAVEEPFARTQAFMAAVVLAKLAGQLAAAEGDGEAAEVERDALVTDLATRLPAPPADVGAALDRLRDDGSDRAWNRLVVAVYAGRLELGDDFDGVLAAVRGPPGPTRPCPGLRLMSVVDDPIEAGIRTYLAERLDAADLVLVDVQRIAVGWSHETWLFDAAWTAADGPRTQGFCVRRDPGNTLLREMSDLGTQFAVLRALDATAVPTPTPYFYEPAPNPLGAPFLVMERVAGTCPSPWGRDGRAFYQAAADRGVLPADFTDALVAIHTLDWRAAGLDLLGVPAEGPDFARREIAKWRALIDATAIEPDPILTDVICWLEANVPATQRLVLVHGAYRTGNLLIDEDRVAAVLDWETEVIGDPMYDVAYVLSELNREGTTLLSNLVEETEFRRRYEAGTGYAIDDAASAYYQLLYAMRSAAFWMSASGLYASGANDDLRLARTAWSIPVVLDHAARALGY